MVFATDNPYRSDDWQIAANAAVDERIDFIRKTYLHLGAAVAAFVGLEAILLQMPGIEGLIAKMVQGNGWLIVLGLFMVVNWVANSWAMSATSIGKQYAGLSLYVVAQAVIFLPLLGYAATFNPNSIALAGISTGVIFGGLTVGVFVTKTDFSFMRVFLMLAGFAAMALIVCSIIFGFELGNVFVVAMIVFASAYILYGTSNVLHHYRIGQHVAASLALFSSVALLFWYLLRFFNSRD